MRRFLTTLIVFAGLSAVAAGPGGPRRAARGFLPADFGREEEFESLFRQELPADQAREDLRVLTSEPHIAGTPADYRTAEYVFNQFKAAGLDAEIVTYDVLLAYPRQVKVDLVAPVHRRGPTPEVAHRSPSAGLPSTSLRDGERSRTVRAFGMDVSDLQVLLPYNAYSPSGDISAEVVYANYGMPEDYDLLKKAGIDVKGKIVLVRYGRCFRGVKVSVAEERGARGLLVYSDPADDGYRLGDTYPRGPWRPPTAVQRGSILSLSDYPGDPLTPGVAATKGARRIPIEKTHLPRIPTSPLSYEDAEPILAHMAGPVAPADWQGALPLNYRLGPGPSRVHLKLSMDFRVRPIWDVMAHIPGAEYPEEWVILGNHRDAWVYGAADPASGTVPLLAAARGFGQLLQKGWRPKRTIFLASWDAEEFGLIGSTEWTEQHAAELAQNAVAYVNVDIGVSGAHFNTAGVPSLSRLLREVAAEVTDPGSGRPLVAVWSEESGITKKVTTAGADAIPPTQLVDPPNAYVRELGSGSDYTPFFEHLGVPSLNFGFEGPYGVYHSEFDNFDWMTNFGDPSFRYSVTTAQILGTLAMRLGDSDLLPFDYEEYGEAIQSYFRGLDSELRRERRESMLPMGDALQAAKQFTETAARVNQTIESAENGESGLREPEKLNRALMEVERDFLTPQGLPGRTWFRHVFFAPGMYTGYSPVLVPGVREAMEREDWPLAARELGLVIRAIERANASLEQGLKGAEASTSAR
jgi:N-acetylated-alpha-linked acidic dipeptidase